MKGTPDPGTPDLTALLLTTKTLEEFLLALAVRSMDQAPSCDGCGITLERDGRPLTVASTGATASRLDEKQYGQDDGPCLQALRTGQEVSVTDMPAERRWGDYPAYAVSCGTNSSLSLPIASRTDTAGAINLYAGSPDGFADADLAVLRSLAAQATGAIALAQRLADVQVFNDGLQAELKSRATVDRATGVVIAQRHCTPQRATAILRSGARRRGITLHEVCAELLGGFGEPPDGRDLDPAPDRPL
ncbi:GAF and ANTAR domain-containing protein [Streptomyces sp. NBC_01476]|uniref:GAF and ANTAR domain-containing protein n=1 Tax=Streptomyces sp. NBC_01476 TaxID=2903881 RepID=UPI002E34AF10|nr:GAF and ANTAR domain-containing protein [Streptomyces sp. NBC_01476]